MEEHKKTVSAEIIEQRIYLIRGQKVMLDRDLAELHGVETRTLIQAVKHNSERFPTDFMFQLNHEEFEALRSQIVISKGKGGRRYSPYAFTEQGVAMLSSVLQSKRAIDVNIQIMRLFTRLRQLLLNNTDLRRELDEPKRQTNDRFQIVFETLDRLLATEDAPKRKIGFTAKKKQATYGYDSHKEPAETADENKRLSLPDLIGQPSTGLDIVANVKG